jgi:hypothetical protein
MSATGTSSCSWTVIAPGALAGRASARRLVFIATLDHSEMHFVVGVVVAQPATRSEE